MPTVWGLPVRAIGRGVGIARNTARKYLKMDEVAISQAQNDPWRTNRLDEHRDFLMHQLKSYPEFWYSSARRGGVEPTCP